MPKETCKFAGDVKGFRYFHDTTGGWLPVIVLRPGTEEDGLDDNYQSAEGVYMWKFGYEGALEDLVSLSLREITYNEAVALSGADPLWRFCVKRDM